MSSFNASFGKYWKIYGGAIVACLTLAGALKSYWIAIGVLGIAFLILVVFAVSAAMESVSVRKELAIADDIWDLYRDVVANPIVYHHDDVELYFECRENLCLFYRLKLVMSVGGSNPVKVVSAGFSVVKEAAALESVKNHLRVLFNGMPVNDIRVKDENERTKRWVAVFPEPVSPGTQAEVVHELNWPGGWDTLKLKDYTDHVSYTPLFDTEQVKITVMFSAEIPFDEIKCEPYPPNEGEFKRNQLPGGTQIEWLLEHPAKGKNYRIDIWLTSPRA